MPAKKASKPKRKSSSSTLTKYSRSRPLGPELKWFDVNTPNSIVGFGLATLIQALNIVPSGTGPNQRIGRTIVVKEIEIKINMQAAWAYVGATVPSAAGISYRVDLILDKQANGAVPLSRHLRHTRCRCISRKSVHELAQQ